MKKKTFNSTEDIALGQLITEMEHIRDDVCDIRAQCENIKKIRKQTKKNTKNINAITNIIYKMKNQLIGGGIVVGLLVTGTVNIDSLAKIFGS